MDGRELPEAYPPITGPLRERLRTAVRDPGTFVDLRWMAADYVYGALGLSWRCRCGWPACSSTGCGAGCCAAPPVVLPLISRLADLDAAWSAAAAQAVAEGAGSPSGSRS